MGVAQGSQQTGCMLERRTNSCVNLHRLDTTSVGTSGSPTSSSGSTFTSPRIPGSDRPTRRGALAVWLIVLALGVLTLLLSMMVYNTARIGFRSVSTTSYVNVNYWPYVVNNNGLVYDILAGAHGQRSSGRNTGLTNPAVSGSKVIRLQLKPKPKSDLETMLNTPRNSANSWPPETPNWELCHARDDPNSIETSGSVFGYFSMYLKCPAAPDYQPTLAFAPPQLTSGVSKTSSNLELLIGVFSGCKAVSRRDTVRLTWARLRLNTDANVQVVFVLARDCKADVATEAAQHNDILFVGVRESYFTLTPKALALLRYGLDQDAQYILKTDDDSFIFVDRVVTELRRIQEFQQPVGEKQPGLYWGRRCSVPLLTDYNNPKLPLFQTSVSKWYYPPHYLRHFEGTAYMCGAAYLVSASIADDILKTDESHHLADEAPFLPEDASVGHLAGPERWESWSCQDHRFILDARRFHGRHLFSADVDDCKRADIFSHALAAHGLKPEHMHTILNYHSKAQEAKCVSPHGFSDRDPGRPFDEWLWQEPLTPLQPQFPEINWQKRLELPASQLPVESGLVPMLSLLKAQHTPWCVRHSWAIQIAELLADLSHKNMLECMLSMDTIYIDPSSMQVKLNEDSDTLVGYERNGSFSSGIPCYADNMCDRCYLSESREGMFGALCNPKTWTCKGYDASHQVKVASHKVLFPLVGRFMHDTPDPQAKYRAGIDESLAIADVKDNHSKADLTRLQAKMLRSLYENFNGQECTSSWLESLAENGDTDLMVHQE